MKSQNVNVGDLVCLENRCVRTFLPSEMDSIKEKNLPTGKVTKTKYGKIFEFYIDRDNMSKLLIQENE